MGSSIVGYRFHPTPEELISHYLRKKRLDPDFSVQKIKEINLYEYEPSELPGLLPFEADEPEWHFFCEPEYKYGNSRRVNRRTRGGNWKVTGKKRDVKDKRKRVIGWKITLVFYEGSGNSKEARTNWVMHEYHIKDDSGFKKEFVVVRIKINPNTKDKAPLTPNGGIPSPNMASNSGNHNPEKNALQVEWQLQQEPQPLANHEICCDRISQLLPNQSCSDNRHTQQVTDRVLHGNSQLLPNYSDQEGQRRSQLAFQNEFCGQETGHSHSLSEHEDNGRKSQSAVRNEFYDQETGHAHSQSGQEDAGRNSHLAIQTESSYGQETGHSYPLIELEHGGRNSLPAIHNEFFGQGIGDSRPSDFSSKPTTGNSVYYDRDETIAALLNDNSSMVTIDDLLNEFSSVANGDCDFNSLLHQSPITILSPRG